ncbi:MAG: type II secretion system protein [Phycisphaerae bacterium]
MRGPRSRGFTLIELLVVVAIIALLISILLPSLTCAREQARAARCGTMLKGLGSALETYFTEFNEWIPGYNTTGMQLFSAVSSSGGNIVGALRRGNLPTQYYDWMTPLLRTQTELGKNRAERMQTLINRYQCPSQASLKVDTLWPINLAGVPDAQDFRDVTEPFSPLSYLMPIWFQAYGDNGRDPANQSQGRPIGSAPNGIPFRALVLSTSWEVRVPDYSPKRDQVGVAARKVAAADGTRYLDTDDVLDFDVNYTNTSGGRQLYGAFTSAGAWWAGATEYGVRRPSTNWDGMTVSPSAGPPANGRALALSYRHGCSTSGGALPTTAQDNKGSINALFFDGHVGRLSDRQSRQIDYWYPKGARVQNPNEGMTRVEANFEVP